MSVCALCGWSCQLIGLLKCSVLALKLFDVYTSDLPVHSTSTTSCQGTTSSSALKTVTNPISTSCRVARTLCGWSSHIQTWLNSVHVLHGRSPNYLSELCTPFAPVTASPFRQLPPTRCAKVPDDTYSRRAFTVARQWHVTYSVTIFAILIWASTASDALSRRFCSNNTPCIHRIRGTVRLCAIHIDIYITIYTIYGAQHWSPS